MPGNSITDVVKSILAKELDWYYYHALNKALLDERRMKPWEDLTERQRQTIVLHVEDMSLWRAESKLDPNDVALRFEQYPELRELLV